MTADPTIFLTLANRESTPAVELLIRSLRCFGGVLAHSTVWVFSAHPEVSQSLESEHTRVLPLSIDPALSSHPFGSKVAACAAAEELAPSEAHALVWIDPNCLIVQPPLLFDLGVEADAAFRPVHIRNVGLPPAGELDAFWAGIYAAVGVAGISSTVTSFVDGQVLRTYFNSHSFAINPQLGLMTRWQALFSRLVHDDGFQAAACADGQHRLFLFQALLSALVAACVDPPRLRLLPAAYNYPYHLQGHIPPERRFAWLNETVCFTYEDLPIHPDQLAGIGISQQLRSWLAANMK